MTEWGKIYPLYFFQGYEKMIKLEFSLTPAPIFPSWEKNSCTRVDGWLDGWLEMSWTAVLQWIYFAFEWLCLEDIFLHSKAWLEEWSLKWDFWRKMKKLQGCKRAMVLLSIRDNQGMRSPWTDCSVFNFSLCEWSTAGWEEHFRDLGFAVAVTWNFSVILQLLFPHSFWRLYLGFPGFFHSIDY